MSTPGLTLTWIWLTAPRARVVEQPHLLQPFQRHVDVGRVVLAHPALEVADDRVVVAGSACPPALGKTRPTLVPGGAMNMSLAPCRWSVASA